MPAKHTLKELLQGDITEPEDPNAEIPSPAAEEKHLLEQNPATRVPPSRRGKRHISGYYEPEVLKLLKQIGIEEDKTVNKLIGEALNLLFVNKGKPPIA